MQIQQHLSLLFSLACIATAQLSSIPACASEGARAALAASGCPNTDIACICKSSSFTTSLEQYAKQNCGTNDYNSVIAMGQSLCASSGVTITTSSAAAGSGSVTGTVSASTVVSTSSASVAATVTTTKKCDCEDDDEPTALPAAPTAVATWTGAAVGRGVEMKMVGMVAGLAGLAVLL